MTSKITSIYNALDTFVSTNLPTYVKIPDSYEPTTNPEIYLKKAYGLAILDGLNTNRLVGCQLSISRNFNIILINQLVSTDSNTTATNDQEKSLMEDQFTLIKEIEKDPSLSQYVAKSLYGSDSGIEFLTGETSGKKYLAIITTFSIEYFENL